MACRWSVVSSISDSGLNSLYEPEHGESTNSAGRGHIPGTKSNFKNGTSVRLHGSLYAIVKSF